MKFSKNRSNKAHSPQTFKMMDSGRTWKDDDRLFAYLLSDIPEIQDWDRETSFYRSDFFKGTRFDTVVLDSTLAELKKEIEIYELELTKIKMKYEVLQCDRRELKCRQMQEQWDDAVKFAKEKHPHFQSYTIDCIPKFFQRGPGRDPDEGAMIDRYLLVLLMEYRFQRVGHILAGVFDTKKYCCSYCKSIWHEISYCPKIARMFCTTCKGYGHVAKYCRKLLSDKSPPSPRIDLPIISPVKVKMCHVVRIGGD